MGHSRDTAREPHSRLGAQWIQAARARRTESVSRVCPSILPNRCHVVHCELILKHEASEVWWSGWFSPGLFRRVFKGIATRGLGTCTTSPSPGSALGIGRVERSDTADLDAPFLLWRGFCQNVQAKRQCLESFCQSHQPQNGRQT